jgi:signal transduction histidine kinase
MILAVLVRLIVASPHEPSVRTVPLLLMGGFIALSVVHHAFSSRYAALTHVFLLLQTAIVAALLFSEPRIDYYAILFIPLASIASRDLPSGKDLPWLVSCCTVPALVMIAGYGPAKAVTLFPVYIAGVLVIGLYGRAARRAEEARARSEELLAALQEANRKLRVYADRAEKAAAAQERARLARELHDAVVQTVFSMNLTAEAARRERRPRKVRALLARVQELAGEALGETRSLVDELRPRTIADEGLVRSLERHAALLKRRERLMVELSVLGSERCDAAASEVLFRTAQEALANVVRHSGVKKARIELRFDADAVRLSLSDEGRGFDPSEDGKGYGLIAMRERVEERGGAFTIRSAPGAGTLIEARIPLGEHDRP